MDELERLLADLEDADPNIRANAAEKIGKHNEGRSAEARLIAALKDESALVRGTAADSLEDLGCVGAIDALIGALSDSDMFVQMSASTALAELASKAEVDLGKVARSLEELAKKVKREGDRKEKADARWLIVAAYKLISHAVAWTKPEISDGVILIGETVRRPKGRDDGMFRKRRAFNG